MSRVRDVVAVFLFSVLYLFIFSIGSGSCRTSDIEGTSTYFMSVSLYSLSDLLVKIETLKFHSHYNVIIQKR